MSRTRTQHSIDNTIWGLIYRLMRMVFPIIIRAFIIREIGIEYVGLNGLFRSVFSVLSLSELGLGSSITYLMYKPAAEGDVKTMRQLLSLLRKIYRIVGFVILGAALALIPFLRFLIKVDTDTNVNYYVLYLMYVFHSVVSYWLYAYNSSIFHAFQEAGVIYKIYVVVLFLQYVLQMAVLVVFRNYYIYLLVYTVAVIPTNLLFHAAAKKYHPEIYCEGEATEEQKQSAKKKIESLFGHRLGNTVIFSIDSIIISAFLGITILAKYDNYNYVLTSVRMLLAVMQTSILASVGNKIVLSSREDTYSLYKRLTYLWIGLIGVCAACFLNLYQPFITVWVGEEYTFDYPIMVVFVMYFFVWQFRVIGIVFKNAAGLWETDRFKPYIGMALNLVLSIVFVKLTNSIVGVMIPTIFVLLMIYYPWETRVLFKELFKRSAKEYILLMARFLFTAFLGIGLSYVVCNQIPFTGWPGIFARLACCLLIVPAVFFIMNCTTRQSKENLAIAKKNLAKITNRNK